VLTNESQAVDVQLMLVVHLYVSPQRSLHIPTLGGNIKVGWAVNTRFL